MSDDLYINEAQQRILKLVRLLAGHEMHGLAPSDIVKALDCTPSKATRDLANLKAAGLAELVPETNRWRLAPPIVQISIRHAAALNRAKDRLDEITNRYSRS